MTPGSEPRAPAGPRPPVALGCTAIAAVLVLAVAAGVLAVGFLESGSAGGRTVLDEAASYAPGSVTFAPAHNLYVVRLADGAFLALADVDAANRADPGRRCRVAPVPVTDPALPALLERYRGRFSPAAAGSTFVFHETCRNAAYDFTGTRLDADGRNLDRYEVDVRDGKLTVNTAKRTCSARDGAALAAPVGCG